VRLSNNHLTALGAFLVPLIPVILLYWLFSEQNYFDLKGGAKYALSAGGPIAAYFILVRLALYQAPKLFSSPLNDSVIGDWTFVSKSSSGKSAKGTASIAAEGGDLVVRGSFREGGQTLETWRSDAALVNSGSMVYLLNLPTAEGTFLNFVTLNLSRDKKGNVMVMSGSWHALRDVLKRGEIEFRRKS
jgi:hypothetical protein